MASITGKTINGQTYYYLREAAWVGGKPKIVSQRYLGKAADIEAAMDGATVVANRTRHLAFGDVAAAWATLERLRVADIVDDVVGPRRADAAASVGTYIALATLNRVVDPCSKLAFSDWWAKTAGDRFVRLAAPALDGRHFWDAMDELSEAQLAEVERRLAAHMVTEFELDLSGLVLDVTNFATYIASRNDGAPAPIAQRGQAQQRWADLHIVGLGLVVSRDGGVPLVSHAYPGDGPDVTRFPALVEELVARFSVLLGAQADEGAARLTLVFDAGQNSQGNYELVEGSPLHFVGSLPPSEHPDLLAVGKARYRAVDQSRFPGLRAFEARMVVSGTGRRVVVTHSEDLHQKQSAGFDQTLAKAGRQLAELAGVLARGRARRPKEEVEAEIAETLKPRWVSRVISTTLVGEEPPDLRLIWRISPEARAALEEELFGKRILFSDKDGVAKAVIVADYRSQAAVEADFRQMKGPQVVSFSPMFHWTDQKIRVHAFACVLALMVARLMVRQADRADLHMSVRELLEALAGIQETVLFYQGDRGRPRARRTLTEMDAAQRRVYDIFCLGAYAPGKPRPRRP
jgi:transposase